MPHIIHVDGTESPFPPEVEEALIDGLDQARLRLRKLLGFFHSTILIDNLVLGSNLTTQWYGATEYERHQHEVFGLSDDADLEELDRLETYYSRRAKCSSPIQPVPTAGGSQPATATPPVARSPTSTPMS